jgi:iodotyrosine deiodinase
VSAYRPVPLAGYETLTPAAMRQRAEDFHAVMRSRRTVRDFSDRPVPRDLVEACLRTAGLAPSGANHQPWHFAVIGDPALKRKIRVAAEEEERAFYAGKAGAEWLGALAPLGTDPDKPFLETAPWLIAVFGERRSRGADGVLRKNYYVPESVSIAVGFLVAALHHAGLATLTHTPSPMGFLNALCGRPEGDKPYFLVVLGHPAEGATVPAHALEKKPLEAIASFL